LLQAGGARDDRLVQVRQASFEDAARIAEIHVLGWQGGYKGLLPQAYLDGLDPNGARLDRWMRSLQMADWSREGTLVVAGADGELAGFAGFGPTRDGDDDAGRVGEIRAIYLRPDSWGQGLGRALMAATLRQLADLGYTEVTLWVLDTNLRAQRFYDAAGFSPDGAAKVDESLDFPLHELRYRRPLR
jgi:RimJ/RimL family protein N-acetyltransferase